MSRTHTRVTRLAIVASLGTALAAGPSPRPLEAQGLEGLLPGDTVRHLGGITVRVARPTLTAGGTSALVLEMDSAGHVPAPSLEDAVRALPLIQVRRNSRGEAQPALRGSRDRQVAILMDGVPLSLGWDHRADLSVIPATAARSLTLVRGLGSLLYGPNTLGGVVSVDVAGASRRLEGVAPLTLGLAVDGNGGSRASATAGRVVDHGQGQWLLRAGGGFEEREGDPLAGAVEADPALRGRFLSDGDRRLNSDARRVDGFATARFLSGRGAWTSFSAAATDVERGVAPEAHQDSPRLWRVPDQRRLITAMTAGSGRRETPLGSGELEATLGLDLGRSRIDQYGSEAFGAVVASEDASDRVATLRVLGTHSVADRGRLQASATVAEVAHEESVGSAPEASYRQRLWSLGTEAAWTLGASDRLTVSFGGAVDGASTPRTGGQPRRGPISDFALRAGARSLVLPGLLLHAGVSRRARFPSLRELYSTALGRFVPNPALAAEALTATEAGFTARGRSGQLQVVGFHHDLDEGIVRTSVTGPGGAPAFMRVNRADVRGRGVELLAFGSWRGLTMTGDLTLQRVRGRDAGGREARLEYEPEVFGRARLEAPLPAALSGSAEVRFVGSQLCENPEAGGLEPLGSSRALDLGLRRSFRVRGSGALGRVSAEAIVRNATDAAVFDQCGLPAPGRLIQIGLRLF